MSSSLGARLRKPCAANRSSIVRSQTPARTRIAPVDNAKSCARSSSRGALGPSAMRTPSSSSSTPQLQVGRATILVPPSSASRSKRQEVRLASEQREFMAMLLQRAAVTETSATRQPIVPPTPDFGPRGFDMCDASRSTRALHRAKTKADETRSLVTEKPRACSTARLRPDLSSVPVDLSQGQLLGSSLVGGVVSARQPSRGCSAGMLGGAGACSVAAPFKSTASGLYGGSYSLVRYLGRGASATVWEASHPNLQANVAIKVFGHGSQVKPLAGREKLCQRVSREMKILKHVKHPKIMGAYEMLESPAYLQLVCELIDGESLHAHSKQLPGRRFHESRARHFYQQILEGVNYCHQRRVVHRDLKLENFVLDKGGENVKIVDFGFALLLLNLTTKLKQFCGTPGYMAPEIVRGDTYCGFGVDMWALGVVLFAMLGGALPFTGRNELQIYGKIRRGIFAWPAGAISGPPLDIIKRLLNPDCAERPAAGTLLSNAWLIATPSASELPSRSHCAPLASARMFAWPSYEKAEEETRSPSRSTRLSEGEQNIQAPQPSSETCTTGSSADQESPERDRTNATTALTRRVRCAPGDY